MTNPDRKFRVPPGWPEEAALAVYADWSSTLEAGVGVVLSVPFPLHPPEVPGASWHRESIGKTGGTYSLNWSTPAHRLRAWAAVGAPVLAPAEDGRPTLAEWVAAAEGSAMGALNWECADGELVGYHPDTGATVTMRPDDAIDISAPNGEPVSLYDTERMQYFATPTTLRAALDVLAVKP